MARVLKMMRCGMRTSCCVVDAGTLCKRLAYVGWFALIIQICFHLYSVFFFLVFNQSIYDYLNCKFLLASLLRWLTLILVCLFSGMCQGFFFSVTKRCKSPSTRLSPAHDGYNERTRKTEINVSKYLKPRFSYHV